MKISIAGTKEIEVDWTLSNAKLGRIHGLTRERFRVLRKEHGIPPSDKVKAQLQSWEESYDSRIQHINKINAKRKQ
jgi:hypothetical protein